MTRTPLAAAAAVLAECRQLVLRFQPVTGQDLIGRIDAATGTVQAIEARHYARVTELLEANNVEVERRRRAERAADAVAMMRAMIPGPAEIHHVAIDGETAYPVPAVSPAPDPWCPTHRHLKRGSTYRVIGTAMLQASTGPVGEAAALVIYKDEKGRLWARAETEFDDGRFEPIAAGDTGRTAR